MQSFNVLFSIKSECIFIINKNMIVGRIDVILTSGGTKNLIFTAIICTLKPRTISIFTSF